MNATPNTDSNGKGAASRHVLSKKPIAIALLLSLVIFSLDLVAPLGVAGGVPYVTLVLYGWWLRKTSAVVLLAVLASILTVLGYLFSPDAGVGWVVFVNRTYALLGIWSTAIALWWISKEAVFQQHDAAYETADSPDPFSIFSHQGMALTVILAFTIALTTVGVQSRVTSDAKEGVAKYLRTVLDTTHISVRTLFKHERDRAKLWAENTSLRAATRELADLPRSPETLINSPAQASIREWLKPNYTGYGHRGFFVIGRDNINLASSRDSNVGLPNLLTKQRDLLDRVWAGETLISHPQPSDVPLQDKNGEMVNGLATMFVATPIRDSQGEVMALLTFRLEPDVFFTKNFEPGQFGNTGETYIFNQNGRLISQQRDNDYLMQIGVTPEQQHSTLYIELRDPGTDLSLNGNFFLPRAKQPLTYMAKSATAGESGSNLQGYRNYRGVPVVGVWLWDDALGLGIATEITVAESFDALNQFRFFTTMFACLLGGLMLIIMAVFTYTQKAITQRDTRNRLILASVGEGIFGLNRQGRIIFVNPTACDMLGYAEGELLGQDLHVLTNHGDTDSAPRASEQEQVYKTIADGQVCHVDSEVWWHKDGFSIPVEYTATPIIDNGGLTGTVVSVKDTTERRRRELELRKLSSVVEQSPASILITDKQGIIEYINPAFTTTYGYSAEEAIGKTPQIVTSGKAPRALYKHLWNTISSGRTWSGEMQNRNKHGEVIWEHVSISPIQSPSGEITHFVGLKEDISKRKRTEQSLKESKAILSAAIENIPGGFLLVDSDGCVEIYNRKFVALYAELQDCIAPGISVDTFLRTGVERGLYPAAKGQTEAWIAEENARYRHKEIEFEQRLKGERCMHIAINQLPDGKWVGLHFEVTELRNAQKEAETANIAKSAFLATMSHEIRTPMNGVIGMLEVLAKSSLDVQQTAMVKVIRDSAFSLLSLLDDILDLSKIEAGRLEPERAPVCVVDIVEGTCLTLTPVAVEKDVYLSLFIDPQVPVQVWSDPTRLRQVLYNLVGNAIKFSGEQSDKCGRVAVRVDVVRGSPLLIFSITDNGIGMSPETLATLFTPFKQAEASTTRRFGGTGLGLAITEKLVNLMRGEIQVESTLGAGSTFTVTLPLEEVAETSAGRLLPDLSGVACILVDSPELNSADWRVYLEHAGAVVQQVADLDQAARQASGLSVPVVIHDLGRHSASRSIDALQDVFAAVPGMRYLLLTRGQHRRARLVNPDVVMMDADALRQLDFLQAVEIAAGRASPEVIYEDTKRGGNCTKAVLPTVAEARAEGRLILVAEDDSINQQVILQQLGILGYMAEVAGNGREALQYWREGDYALLLSDLHMPEMDGYQLTEAIRREEAESGQSPMPILAVTANALIGEANRARAAGMNDYLTKPVQLHLLGAALEKWLPWIEVAAEQPTATRGGQAVSVVDVDVLKGLVGDDTETVNDVLAAYLTSVRQLTTELRAAYAEDNSRHIGALAHKLKSSSRSVGALALGDLYAELENACTRGDKAAIEHKLAQIEMEMADVTAQIMDILEVQST